VAKSPWRNRIVGYSEEEPDQLLANPSNWRIHPAAQQNALSGVLKEVGLVQNVVANRTTGHLVDGHLRVMLAMRENQPVVPVTWVELSEEEEHLILAALDPLAAMATADAGALDALLSSVQSGEAGVQAMLASLAEEAGLYAPTEGDGPLDGLDKEAARSTLADRFIVPPFSVLDARQGYWQERKRAWLALGLKGELGRGDKLTFGDEQHRQMAHKKGGLIQGGISGGDPKFYQLKRAKEKELGITLSTTEFRVEHYTPEDSRLYSKESGRTSVMDPVLCELAYRWFCPQEGHVINPTAGESVYGIVAGYLGYTYEGVELRPEQIADNEQQAVEIGVDDKAKWIHGDGRNTAQLVAPADLIMCCPPYHDLEVYSDDPQDISTLDDYSEFMEAYRQIVASAVDALKPDRFACFVVGDIRDKRGHYRNFVSDTIGAFKAAGCELYNEAAFITPAGSLPIRVGKQFSSSRKLGKSHQNVLIFIKGDWRKAVEACGPVTVEVPDDFGTDNDNDD
jgi:hypothetical protein